jgi:hypothetical protein
MPRPQRTRVRPVATDEPVYYTSTLGTVQTATQRKQRITHMRLTGTGKDPEGRYSKGLIFDAPEQDAQSIIEKGWAKETAPEDDPGRTDSQLAAAAVRGDTLSDPIDRELAQSKGFVDEFGEATVDAYDRIHEEDGSLEVEPADTTPVRQAESSGEQPQNES